jgi:hypothetical protein
MSSQLGSPYFIGFSFLRTRTASLRGAQRLTLAVTISDGSAVVLDTWLLVVWPTLRHVPSTHVRVWSSRHDYDLSRDTYLCNVYSNVIAS